MDTLEGVLTLRIDAPAPGAAQLHLAGHLDGAGARDLLHAAAVVVRSGCSSLVVDLDGLTGWDEDAAYAVVGCTRLARWLPEGVDVHASAPVAVALAGHVGVAQAAAWPAADVVALPAVAALTGPS